MNVADAEKLKKGARVTVTVPNEVRYHATVAAAGLNDDNELYLQVVQVVTNTTRRRIEAGKKRYANVCHIAKR